MYPRLIQPPKKSFFLFGPRGTGKTTWIKARFPGVLIIDLLESQTYNDLLARPDRLETMIPEHSEDWVIIDEIQRVPELLNEVHRLIENRRLKFVLTGSSARKLRRKGVNLLGGRALTLAMHPLTPYELGEDFSLDKAIVEGLLPSVWTEDDPKAYLESYLKTYLREEVQEEGLTRNLPAFSRFLEAASFSHGMVLNISRVAQECAIDRRTTSNYFSILEDLLIGVQLPVFSKRAKRRLIRHNKFYFFDCGVFQTIRPRGPLDQPEAISGIAAETFVLQVLRAVQAYSKGKWDLYYWRTSTGFEVDFVVYGEKVFFVLEVKHSNRIRREDLRGVQAFLEDYPQASAKVFYFGDRGLSIKGIEVLPIEKALEWMRNLLTVRI